MAFAHSFPLVLFIFASLSLADKHATSPVPPETFCHSTRDPSYCNNVFANQNGNIHDYGRISFRKSLSQSRKFLSLVDSYLQSSSSFSQPIVRALQDCHFLAELNLEYLSNTFDIVDKTNNVLASSQAEDIQTSLSAVLTNQQTCLDGLETVASNSRVKNDLSLPLSDDTKLHSLSLDIFAKGWMPEKKIATSWARNGRHLNFRNGRLPLKMSERVRAIYDSARGHRGHGRKLLQTGDEEETVLVLDIVIVSQDGSGNFTTINDAIAAAPNNTAASAGYFMIYITEGVYQEYVSIDKKKTYLMLLGDGINRTIITGNQNVVDGSTTFNSATFGKP
ncbi:hypothetical protein L6164_034717 [Bauhinia variegata]|uniref:Uncharacterized protein n=1 Tax=Bauhinia variegata TaxID=167791 RepID=A0ACB9KX23_BAUVA|nr:hypothetical protein L6164_034717 [Bauhinia variegata]